SSGCTTYERPIKGTLFADLQIGAAILLRGNFDMSDKIARQQRVVSERVVPGVGKKFANREGNLFVAPSYVHPRIKRCKNNGQIRNNRADTGVTRKDAVVLILPISSVTGAAAPLQTT